jgi:hypothetical protein
MRNIKQKKRNKKSFDLDIVKNIIELQSKLKLLRADLTESDEIVKSCDCGLLNLRTLKNALGNDVYDAFLKEGDQFEKLEKIFLEWLGFFHMNEICLNLRKNSNSNFNYYDNNNEDDDEIEEMESETKEEIFDKAENFEDNDFNDRMLEEHFYENQYIKSSQLPQTKKEKNSEQEAFLKKFIITIKEINSLIIQNEKQDGWSLANPKVVKKQQNIKIKNYLKYIIHLADTIDISTSKCKEKLEKLEKDLIQFGIWSLSMDERYLLYNYWVFKYKLDYMKRLELLKEKYNKYALRLIEMQMQEDRECMQDALIIACTTTGSARYSNILKDIGARIIIVEEAAEVFEAHVISSLSSSCEHLILIGDHVQLRPSPNVHSLAVDYKLDISLFERLLLNNVKKVMLTNQHRMHPQVNYYYIVYHYYHCYHYYFKR